MKKIFSFIVFVSLLVGIIGLAAGCKKQESMELNFFNWTEYMPQEIIDKFEEETGIKVNYNTYSSNEEMLAKVSASHGMYDLVVASDYMVDIMVKQELLEDIEIDKLENIENIGDNFMDKEFDPENKYTVPYMAGSALIAVNTSMIDKEINHYEDLWDPALEDSIVVLDDERGLMGITLRKLGYSMNETDPAILDEVKEDLLKLKPNIKAFDSDSPKTLLISGEVPVGYVWSAEAVLAQYENPDIKIVMPDEGLYLWQDNLAIPQDAPNKENAQKFIDFFLRPEISKIFSESRPYTNPNVAAQNLLADDIKNDPGVYPPAEVYENGEYLKDVGETTTLYDKIWTEFKQE